MQCHAKSTYSSGSRLIENLFQKKTPCEYSFYVQSPRGMVSKETITFLIGLPLHTPTEMKTFTFIFVHIYKQLSTYLSMCIARNILHYLGQRARLFFIILCTETVHLGRFILYYPRKRTCFICFVELPQGS